MTAFVGKEKRLVCCDCKQSFAWSPEDQAFFASKGWAPPKRCPGCRSQKKAKRLNSREEPLPR